MSTERLFEIIYFLLNNKKATTTELASLFEVSTRTIHRDINKLSSLGIPIYTEPGRNGGIYLLNNFILDKVLLSKEEQDNLLLALKGTRKINPEISDQSFSKLHSLFNQSFDDWLEVDFSRWRTDISKDDQPFELIKTSILNRNELTFTYISAKGTLESRRCQPHRLVFKSQSWYVQAFCLSRNAFRMFKVNRMSSIKKTDQLFSKIERLDSLKITSSGVTVSMTLEFSKEIFYRVYDEFDHDSITLKNSDVVIVKTEFPDEDWLIRYLLSFGKHIKILSPDSIKGKIAEELKIMSSNILAD